MIVATWKPNIPHNYNADAQTVAEEIMSIGESATPKQIVDKARNEQTELHKCFEWNDTKAAEQYRLRQARQVCANLVIVHQEQKKPAPRVFYLVKNEQQQNAYKRIDYIVQKPNEYQQLLERAMRELKAFKVKYQMLTELNKIFELIN